MKEEVVIIGGGLAGLAAAYTLQKRGVGALLLESAQRLGGRIYTKTSGNQQFELGATWVFEDPLLKELVKELRLSLYPQYLTGDALIKYDPSMETQRSPTESLMNGALYHKIEGGTGALIQALADQLEPERIVLDKKVEAMAYDHERIILTMADGSIIEGTQVIIAVPPKAIAQQIKISPPLKDHQLMQSTHTWMGESAKFTVLLDRDYWRAVQLSGFVYSNYGLIREMQDHVTKDGQSFGLLGFIRPTGELIHSFEKRKQLVARELIALLGIQEENILAYDDFLWCEYFTDKQGQNYNNTLMPHQHNGHSFYLQPHFDQHLFFAGAETSVSNPGYMEGALRSAYRAVSLLLGDR